jgi:hypothetical protein
MLSTAIAVRRPWCVECVDRLSLIIENTKMMNSVIRRMAAVGISKTATRGSVSRLSGLHQQQQQQQESSSSDPSWSSSSTGMQRLPFSTEAMRGFEVPVVVDVKSQGQAFTIGSISTDAASGQHYGRLLETRQLPKLKPSIVARRLANCKIYIGQEKAIRQSPWKLNRICQLAAGLTLDEALTQLKFCPLKNADLVAKVLKRTSNLADIRHGLQISQLEVAECFTTKSMMLRRIKPMGRGRYVQYCL